MNRVRVKENTYLIKEPKPHIVKVLHPQVKINGEWCYLEGNGTMTGLAEGTTEVDAYKQGVTAFLKITEKEAEQLESNRNA